MLPSMMELKLGCRRILIQAQAPDLPSFRMVQVPSDQAPHSGAGKCLWTILEKSHLGWGVVFNVKV